MLRRFASLPASGALVAALLWCSGPATADESTLAESRTLSRAVLQAGGFVTSDATAAYFKDPRRTRLRWYRILKGGQKITCVRAPEKGANAFLKRLPVLPALRALDLSRTDFSHGGAAALARQTSLRVLHLGRNAKVSDQVLGSVAKLKSLHSLYLERTRVTDGGLALLAALPELRLLDLTYVSLVRGPGLRALRQLKNLEVLRLRQAYMLPAGDWKALGTLQALREVDLSHNTNVKDAHLAVLGKLEGLRKLDLTATSITDAGLEHLGALKELRELRLDGTAVSGVGLLHLPRPSPMEKIWLSSSKALPTGAEMVGLGGFDKLSYLNIGNNSKLENEALTYVRGLKSLKTLDLSNTRVGDAGILELTSMETLKLLNVYRTQVTRKGVRAFRKKRPGCRVHAR